MIVVEGGRENKSLIVWLLFIYLDDVSVSYILFFWSKWHKRPLNMCAIIKMISLYLYPWWQTQTTSTIQGESPNRTHFYDIFLSFCVFYSLLRLHSRHFKGSSTQTSNPQMCTTVNRLFIGTSSSSWTGLLFPLSFPSFCVCFLLSSYNIKQQNIINACLIAHGLLYIIIFHLFCHERC